MSSAFIADLTTAREHLASLTNNCSDLARIIDHVHLNNDLFERLKTNNDNALINTCDQVVTRTINDRSYTELMGDQLESVKMRSLLMHGNDKSKPSPDELLRVSVNTHISHQCDFCDVLLADKSKRLTSSFMCPKKCKKKNNWERATSMLNIVVKGALKQHSEQHPETCSYSTDPDSKAFVSSTYGQECLKSSSPHDLPSSDVVFHRVGVAIQHFFNDRRNNPSNKSKLFSNETGSAWRKHRNEQLFAKQPDHSSDLRNVGLGFVDCLDPLPQNMQQSLLFKDKDGCNLGSALLLDSLLSEDELKHFVDEHFSALLFMPCSSDETNRHTRVSSVRPHAPAMFGSDQSPKFIRADSISHYEKLLLDKANELGKFLCDGWLKCLVEKHGVDEATERLGPCRPYAEIIWSACQCIGEWIIQLPRRS